MLLKCYYLHGRVGGGGGSSRLILRFEDRGAGENSENRDIPFLPALST